TDELRDRLVPVNRRWPLRELMAAAREYGERVGRRVTLEYTLLAGVNDRAEDADRLAAMARALPSKINLIPYNPVPGLAWKRPERAAVEAFAHRLLPHAPAVPVRRTPGGAIWAACRQLGGLGACPRRPRPRGSMTLRARLTLALLALALIPTALYTAFTLDQLGRSAERWFRPGVNRALESALETTRTTLAFVEAAALAQSETLASGFPTGALNPRER